MFVSRFESVLSLALFASTAFACKDAPSGYSLMGCYVDSGATKLLSTAISFADAPDVSWEKCAASCSGSQYFGLEAGYTCYCGSSLSASAVQAPAAECNHLCSGDADEWCGGSQRIDLFARNGTIISSALPSSTPAAASSTPVAVSSIPVVSAAPSSVTVSIVSVVSASPSVPAASSKPASASAAASSKPASLSTKPASSSPARASSSPAPSSSRPAVSSRPTSTRQSSSTRKSSSSTRKPSSTKSSSTRKPSSTAHASSTKKNQAQPSSTKPPTQAQSTPPTQSQLSSMMTTILGWLRGLGFNV